MKRKMMVSLVALFSVLILFNFSTGVSAFEIITAEDLKEKTVTKVDLVRVVDNFIILFDASGSMADPYRNTGEQKIEAAKRILMQQNEVLPDLGFNAALCTFTPMKTYYPMKPYDKAAFRSAIESLPTTKTAGAFADQPTPLAEGIMAIEPMLKEVSGKTAVFIFSDGTYTLDRYTKLNPLDAARKIATDHKVIFYFISSASTPEAKKFLDDMAAINQSSRVVSFDAMYANPVIGGGALYVVKSTVEVETVTEKRVAGVKMRNILFPFDSTEISSEDAKDLDKLGDFLQKNPESFVVLAGYSDISGPEEYNITLSRRRAESVAKYLVEKWNFASERIVMFWYGQANPVGSNDTQEGRAQNRRVELAVGGLS